jgi:hypothetical protein
VLARDGGEQTEDDVWHAATSQVDNPGKYVAAAEAECQFHRTRRPIWSSNSIDRTSMEDRR